MACGALALGAPALARADEQLVPSGSLAYTWHATPQLGCARENLCGVYGAVTVDVQSADFVTQRHFPSPLQLSVAATARTQGPGPGTSCVDLLDVDELDLNLIGPSITAQDIPEDSLSSGHCPGPLTTDLGRLSVPVRRIGHHRPSFDLSGSRTISAGPYEISLRSTLRLDPGHNGLGSSTSVSGGKPVPSPRGRQFVEQVALRYRLASSAGNESASFQATAGQLCETVGDCGSSGSLSVSTVTARRRITLLATRLVRRPVGRARALSDLRAGRLSGEVQVPARAVVSEAIAGGQAAACSDTRSSPLSLEFADFGRQGEVDLLDIQGDALRTHCPGPLDADVIPDGVTVAHVMVGAGQLGAGRITLTSALASYSSLAYGSRWGGSLALTFVRVGLRAGTLKGRAS
jgi:hypothetical protein